MKYLASALFVTLLSLLTSTTYSQLQFAQAGIKSWNAQWIAAPLDDGYSYGVFYFRKNIDLATRPTSFVIHVSADNRYKLFVNGVQVSQGPARGDIYNWNYETVDLAPFLVSGKNNISALVFNEAQARPEAQITVRTAFIIQGNTSTEEQVNTNNTWKCIRDNGYRPLTGFFAASAGEIVDMNKTVPAWNDPALDDSDWPFAVNLFQGQPKGMSDGFGWMLVPSALPPMEMTYQRLANVRESDGVSLPASFPTIKTDVIVPAHTTATILLDQAYLTNAYVTVDFSKGKGAGISLGYAESLFDNLKLYGARKGNRDSVTGKDFSGRKDSLLSSGADHQRYTTLYWRSFRYLRLVVTTRDEPLLLHDIYGTFIGYPFKLNASLKTDNEEIKQMLDIGWRTARLCAIETYFDCPYYEQLQYIGDTRIQAMVSYYNSGDDRLARNAINLIDHSRLAEGITQSRWPTHSTQIISTFSLWYIGMLHDYWMYRGDEEFVKSKLQGERAILDFFSRYQQPDGSLKNTPFWTFVDWANGKDWFIGAPPRSANGNSAILDLQLLWTYQWAAQMEYAIGMKEYADRYAKKIVQLKQAIQRKYWDATRGLYADTEEKKLFSQHANSLAILTGMVPQRDLTLLCKKLLNDKSLTECTIYFKYYMNQALVKGGLGDDYLNWLNVWRDNIKMGLTTWAEVSDLPYSRSDCHAWGASPNIEFFRTILGIDSDAPGFSKIKIEPHLGSLKKISGSMPHPKGNVSVSYELIDSKWQVQINLPIRTSGIFIWKGRSYALRGGQQHFSL
jgi:hypothetical protein